MRGEDPISPDKKRFSAEVSCFDIYGLRVKVPEQEKGEQCPAFTLIQADLWQTLSRILAVTKGECVSGRRSRRRRGEEEENSEFRKSKQILRESRTSFSGSHGPLTQATRKPKQTTLCFNLNPEPHEKP